jgi:hypothetical protein
MADGEASSRGGGPSSPAPSPGSAYMAALAVASSEAAGVLPMWANLFCAAAVTLKWNSVASTCHPSHLKSHLNIVSNLSLKPEPKVNVPISGTA